LEVDASRLVQKLGNFHQEYNAGMEIIFASDEECDQKGFFYLLFKRG